MTEKCYITKLWSANNGKEEKKKEENTGMTNGSTELYRYSRSVEVPQKRTAHVTKDVFTVHVQEFVSTCVTVRNDIYNTVRHVLKERCLGPN